MENDDLARINAAEIEAETFINQALQQSKDRIKEAEQLAHQRIEKAKEELVITQKKVVDHEYKLAEEMNQHRLEEWRLSTIKLRERAKARYGTVIDLIMERIVR